MYQHILKGILNVKLSKVLAVTVLALPGLVFAQNSSDVTQTGSNNDGTVNQLAGGAATGNITQTQSDNIATIDQGAAAFEATITQDGIGNEATISQSVAAPDDSSAIINQTGDSDVATVNMRGGLSPFDTGGSLVTINQAGTGAGNDILANITGGDNVVTLDQDSEGNSMTLNLTGNGNTVDWSQVGATGSTINGNITDDNYTSNVTQDGCTSCTATVNVL